MVRFLTNECGLEDTKTGETIALIEYDENGNETINFNKLWIIWILIWNF